MNEKRQMPVLAEEKERCCGCTACMAVCPVEAIGMEADEEGFFYPVIDPEKCIGCCKCLKVCIYR